MYKITDSSRGLLRNLIVRSGGCNFASERAASRWAKGVISMRFLKYIPIIIGVLAVPVSAATTKPIVAIEEMEDLAGTGKAEMFSTMVATAIQNTGKFRVMERRMGNLVREQTRAKGGIVTSNTPGRAGGFEGVDYLIYGTLTSVSSKSRADIGTTLLSNLLSSNGSARKSCSNVVATIAVDIKITDADSGEIKYVTRIDQSQTSAASCSGNAQIDSVVLLRTAADKVATGLVTAIYPIQVAAMQSDGSFVLNYGQGSIEPGAIMAVYSKGQEIRDPSSGEIIGNDETKLGLIRIGEVTRGMSKAVAISPFTTAARIGSIVRLASPEDVRSLKYAKKQK